MFHLPSIVIFNFFKLMRFLNLVGIWLKAPTIQSKYLIIVLEVFKDELKLIREINELTISLPEKYFKVFSLVKSSVY